MVFMKQSQTHSRKETRKEHRSRKKGQATVEMVIGCIALVPILLFLIDIGVLVLANYINDDICHRAARAAANQVNAQDAQTSASLVLSKFSKSTILPDLECLGASSDTPSSAGNVDYDQKAPGQVVAATRITVKIPVPFPLMPETATFISRSVVPIVAQKAR